MILVAAVGATVILTAGCGKTPEQEFKLGKSYSQGSDGKEKNLAEAAKYYQKAADRGYVPAQYELAL